MSIEEAIELLERSIRDGQRMIDEHSLLTDEHGYKEFEDGINARKAILALLKTHPETKPNEPLTLEELREMNGNPVWMDCGLYKGFALLGVGREGMISATDKETKTWWIYTNWGYNDRLGAKLYRRPPKEET